MRKEGMQHRAAGLVLAGLLGLSAVAKAIIGSHYNYGLSMVTVR
jgi:hypothetical protein